MAGGKLRLGSLGSGLVRIKDRDMAKVGVVTRIGVRATGGAKARIWIRNRVGVRTKVWIRPRDRIGANVEVI